MPRAEFGLKRLAPQAKRLASGSTPILPLLDTQLFQVWSLRLSLSKLQEDSCVTIAENLREVSIWDFPVAAQLHPEASYDNHDRIRKSLALAKATKSPAAFNEFPE